MKLCRNIQQYEPRFGMLTVKVAVCMAVIIAAVAFAVDGGMIFERKRQMQSIADSSALAGAKRLYDIFYQYYGQDFGGTAKANAIEVANGNIFDPDRTTVTVNIPPTSGDHKGMDSYVEVIVEYKQPRFFSTIFGASDIIIRARAVAEGAPSSYGEGIIILDQTAPRAMNVHGNGIVDVKASTVIVNSADIEAGYAGSQTYVRAGTFQIQGGVNDPTHFNGTINTGVPPTPDPLRNLPAPDPDALIVRSNKKLKFTDGINYLLPGVYKGGIDASSSATLVLSPGIYYMEGINSGGGFSFSGQGNLTGTEVMIYNAPHNSNDRIDISGQGIVSITPPTSGTYTGMSIFQQRDASDQPRIQITGNGQFDVEGTIYGPGALAMIEGNGDKSIGSQYIVRTLDVGGNGNLNVTYDGNKVPKYPQIRLVE